MNKFQEVAEQQKTIDRQIEQLKRLQPASIDFHVTGADGKTAARIEFKAAENLVYFHGDRGTIAFSPEELAAVHKAMNDYVD